MRFIASLSIVFFVSFGHAATDMNGSYRVLGNWNASESNTTRACKAGTTLPATCAVSECFFDTDTVAGLNLFGCTATDVWTQLGLGNANYTQSFSAVTSVTLTHNLNTAALLIQCFDSSKNKIGTNAITIGSSAPYDVAVTFNETQSGECHVNGISGIAGLTGSGSGVAPYAADFTATTSLTTAGTTHLLGSKDLTEPTVYDTSTDPQTMIRTGWTVNTSSFDVVVPFPVSQAGRIVLPSGTGETYFASFESTTSLTVTGATHGFGTRDVSSVTIYDASWAMVRAGWTIDADTFDVTVAFPVAQAGYIVMGKGKVHKYAAAFSATTSLVITGATHGLGTRVLTATVYDTTANPSVKIQAGFSVNSSNGDVTIPFPVSQAGRVVLGG
jgi:hypothetical protein